MDKPEFISRSPDALVQEMVEDYQQTVGKELYPAQPERLFINWMAYRQSLHREQVQDAALLNLVRWSRGTILDQLAIDRDSPRLPAYPAGCTLEFRVPTLQATDFVIPEKTIVGLSSGAFSVATQATVILKSGQPSVQVKASATTDGTVGNGYIPGQLNQLISALPGQPLGLTVTNTTVTDGGAEAETDERLQQRLLLAPDQYSVAGPAPAYRYLAMKAHPSVVDVAVLSPRGGQVVLYPLLDSGLPGQTVLDAIQALVASPSRRVLCARVSTVSPLARPFTLKAVLTLKDGALPSDVLPLAQQAASAQAARYSAALGGSIIPEDFTAALQPLVRRAEVLSPVYAGCAENEWRQCTAIDLSIAG